jgi:cytochrome d ubiquinol oxidase subunit I
VGVAMPAFMALAEWRYLVTGDPVWRELSKRWAKGTAILFAVGAVSGTVLSFELGLLWPRFMEFSGSVIGLPFALEGFAFFTEAIFLGILLYGWDRVSPRMHLFSAVVVALSGAASAFFVTCANAWMNTPGGFRMEGGKVVDVDPLAAMFVQGWWQEVLHVLISCYEATAFAVAGIHALLLLRGASAKMHRCALGLALTVGGVCAVLQPISGDFSARSVHARQPAKLAAMEGQFLTEAYAPLRIGGWPDPENRTTRWAIEIPGGLSFLATHDRSSEIQGLMALPRDEWPNVRIVHVCFQIMVLSGLVLAATGALAAFLWWRGGRALPVAPRFLKWVVAVSPLGFVAMEAGWMVTESGRQPWIIWKVMRASDAVTPATGLWVSFWSVTAVYVLLSVATGVLLWRQIAPPEKPS